MILYGIVGALFSYCVALVFKTPLAAFAAVAAYQAVMFMVGVFFLRLGDHELTIDVIAAVCGGVFVDADLCQAVVC